MNAFKAMQVLQQIEACGTARLEKLALLSDHKKNPCLQELVRLTYGDQNFFIAPDMDVVDALVEARAKAESTPVASETAYAAFVALAQRLSGREVTGHAARDAIVGFFDTVQSGYEVATYAKVLNRDLRLGLNKRSFQQVWPGMFAFLSSDVAGTPEFKGCMLASEVGKKKGKSTIQPIFPCYAEPKADGIRVTVVADEHGAAGFTRNGKTYPTLFAVEAVLSQFPGYMFDGEILAKNWNDTSKLFKRQSLDPVTKERIENELNFLVFDLLPLDEYYANGKSTEGYLARRSRVERMALEIQKSGHVAAPRIQAIESIFVEDATELRTYYQGCLDRGYEGVMLKTPDGLYEVVSGSTRPLTWLKLKPTKDETVVVIGFEPGKRGTKNENRLGALVCRALDDPNRIYNVGGGFTDKQREEFWEIREQLLGAHIDVKIQDEKGNDIVSRFPRFMRLRPDLDR